MNLIVIETGRVGTMTAMRAEETATGSAMMIEIAETMTEAVCDPVYFVKFVAIFHCHLL